MNNTPGAPLDDLDKLEDVDDLDAARDEVVRQSQRNAAGPHGLAGGMGVSSERLGPTGTGEIATDSTRPTSTPPLPDEAPPEQSPGNPEENPVGIPPKAGHA